MTRWIQRVLCIVHLLKRRGSPDEQPPLPPLLELPIDIFRLILPHLPLVSHACLALTCKPLYRLLRCVFDDERLAWPRLLASRSYELIGSQPHLPRNELLLKLEDNRWMYCSGCLKLHLKNRFTLSLPNVPPSDRLCNYNVWVVDVCACLALTFFHGIQLVEWLETGTPSLNLHRNIRELFQSQLVNNKRVLLHHCSITSHEDAFISLATTVTLDASHCLIVATRFNVHWTKPHNLSGPTVEEPYRPSKNTDPVALCPHLHAIAWLYSPSRRSRNECGCCDTMYYLLGRSNDGLHCVVKGVRNLGDVRVASRVASSVNWWFGSRRPLNAIWRYWYSSHFRRW